MTTKLIIQAIPRPFHSDSELFKVADKVSEITHDERTWDATEQIAWMVMKKMGIDLKQVDFSYDSDIDENGNEFEIMNIEYI